MSTPDPQRFCTDLLAYLDAANQWLRDVAARSDNEPEDTYVRLLLQLTPEERLTLFEVAAHCWSRLGDFITALQMTRKVTGEAAPSTIELEEP